MSAGVWVAIGNSGVGGVGSGAGVGSTVALTVGSGVGAGVWVAIGISGVAVGGSDAGVGSTVGLTTGWGVGVGISVANGSGAKAGVGVDPTVRLGTGSVVGVDAFVAGGNSGVGVGLTVCLTPSLGVGTGVSAASTGSDVGNGSSTMDGFGLSAGVAERAVSAGVSSTHPIRSATASAAPNCVMTAVKRTYVMARLLIDFGKDVFALSLRNSVIQRTGKAFRCGRVRSETIGIPNYKTLGPTLQFPIWRSMHFSPFVIGIAPVDILADARNRPDVERRGFYPLPDQDNPESAVVVEAVLEHFLVTVLEDPERQRGARKEDRTQRKKWQSARHLSECSNRSKRRAVLS